MRHALPNAWAPIANVIALNLAYLVVGVVVVEVVFVYPGIGQLMVDAVSSRDMPVVQGCALMFAATYILLNLLADIVAIVTNPRLAAPAMSDDARHSAGEHRSRRDSAPIIAPRHSNAPGASCGGRRSSAWFGIIVIASM